MPIPRKRRGGERCPTMSERQEDTPARGVALHVCCGPCASACVPRLVADGYRVTMVFANSNIDTEEEFERRRAAAERLAENDGVGFVALEYDHGEWLSEVAAGFESEKEGGSRCERCFRYSLAKTAQYASSAGIPLFTSSLSVSPHKNSRKVFAAGAAAGEGFLEVDFKKKDGFLLSVRRSEELGLYRQSYCGCEFSKNMI